MGDHRLSGLLFVGGACSSRFFAWYALFFEPSGMPVLTMDFHLHRRGDSRIARFVRDIRLFSGGYLRHSIFCFLFLDNPSQMWYNDREDKKERHYVSLEGS